MCASVGNVRGYRRYVDMYTSEYQRHSPTVGLHAEGLALQCLSLIKCCRSWVSFMRCIGLGFVGFLH